jgi:hypothetical protein
MAHLIEVGLLLFGPFSENARKLEATGDDEFLGSDCSRDAVAVTG